MKPRTKQMPASQLSMVLTGILIILIVILVGGSALAASILIGRSRDAAHAAIDTDVSAEEPQRLEELKRYLAQNKTGIAQTAQLTAGIGSYNQTSIVSAISGYAAKAGVSVASFDFQQGTVAAAAAPNSVTVTLASPMPYTRFITFLKLLEQGLMPAEITEGSVTAGEDGSGTVTVSPLTIRVAG